MRPTAKSLILDLLSTLREGSMPVRALVSAAALFSIEENNVRVTLARLYAAGGVERDERGRYRLGARTEAVRQQIASWRRIDERLDLWDGDWVGVHTGSLPGRRGRLLQRRRQALRLLGFRELEPGIEIRPDNLVGGIEWVRGRLFELGLTAGTLVCGIRALDPTAEVHARSLWDASLLVEGYRQSIDELEQSERRLSRLSPEEAMVESFLVGGRVLRQLVLDPLLPEPIVPAASRNALLRAMRHYDLVGRSGWADFLARFDVPHLRTPIELGVAEASAQLLGSSGYETRREVTHEPARTG